MPKQLLFQGMLFLSVINFSYADTLYFPTTAEEIERALSVPHRTPSESSVGRLRGPGMSVRGNLRGPSRIVDDPTTITSQPQAIENRNSLANTEDIASFQEMPKVGAMVHFDFNSARIRPESHTLLNEFAKALRSPSLSATHMIVAGHTDSKGSAEYNRILSQHRAQSVKDYLVKRGIPSKQLIVRGFGEADPIASNTTEQGRALNRRCEFIRADGG